MKDALNELIGAEVVRTNIMLKSIMKMIKKLIKLSKVTMKLIYKWYRNKKRRRRTWNGWLRLKNKSNQKLQLWEKNNLKKKKRLNLQGRLQRLSKEDCSNKNWTASKKKLRLPMPREPDWRLCSRSVSRKKPDLKKRSVKLLRNKRLKTPPNSLL